MKDYSSYVALVVATETEEKAIKNMYDWKPITFSDDTQTYYSASIEKNGSSHKIVYARQSEMGMTVAVTLTMKLIEHFRPQFMIMVGIAAGIARSNMAEQIYGDVVVADGNRTIALLGVNDMVVVDTPDALLVVPRARSQEVKDMVKKLDQIGRDDIL